MSDASPVVATATASAVVARLDDGGPNVIGFASAAALTAAVDRAAEVGLPLVIMGRQGMFSAGFDLNVLNDDVNAFADLVMTGAELLRHIVEAPVPVVMGVTGHAVAMGALLTMAADYRIGAEGRFKIGLNEVAIGLTLPDWALAIAMERLSRRHLQASIANARLYDGAGAVDAGFLDTAVGPDAVVDTAVEHAAALAELDPGAYAATVKALRGSTLARMAGSA